MLEQLKDLAAGNAGGNVNLTISAPLAGYAFRLARVKGIDLSMEKIGGVFHINGIALTEFVNAVHGYEVVKVPDPETAAPEVEVVDVNSFGDDGGLLSLQDVETVERDGPVEFKAPLPAGARASGPGPEKNPAGGRLLNTAKSPKDRSTNDEGGGNDMTDATSGVGSEPTPAIDPTDPSTKPHRPSPPRK